MTTHKDPVCGMDVTEDAVHHVEHDKQQYYFCSEKCQHKFEQDPQQYLHKQESHSCCHGHKGDPEHKGKPRQPVDESAIYTCPMHLEVEQIGPGTCPKCGAHFPRLSCTT
jgi:Cu+-exporting ATPase